MMPIGPLVLLAVFTLAAPGQDTAQADPRHPAQSPHQQGPQQQVDATQALLAKVAARAEAMRPYTFELRAEVKGLDRRPAPVRVEVAAGQPVHFVEGKLEAYVQDRRIVLREGDGDWDVMEFALNPMLQRMARAWQGAMAGTGGGETGNRATSEQPPADRPKRTLAHPPSPEARLQAVKILYVPLPHVILARVRESLEKVEVKESDGKVILTADLNEATRRKLRPLLPGGGRARPRSEQDPGWKTQARIRLTMRPDGQVLHYEMAVRHSGTYRGRPFDQRLAHAITISRVGTTELVTPPEVLALF